jgi:serine protease
LIDEFPEAIDHGTLEWVGETADAPDAAVRARGGAAALPYAPGKVIVKFRTTGAGGRDLTPARARDLSAVLGRVRIERPRHADFSLLYFDPDLDPEAVAVMLAARDDVEYAQAAYKVRPYYRPNDPLYDRQWNLSLIGMEAAWDINEGASESIVVAVLDTGVAFQNASYAYTAGSFTNGGVTYPALGRIVVPFAAAPDLASSGRFVTPYDFIYDDPNPVDMDGHGTHVSGTVGQLTNNGVGAAGVAFKVRIMPVKCISTMWDDIFNSPYVGTDDVVARAIRYAADNGADVINLSLGRNEGPSAPAIGSAMRYAVSRGAFIAVAGGNDYEDGNPIERLAEQAGPIAGAMAVAAVGPDGNRAYYSGVQSYIEIAAPGGNRRVSSNGGVWQQTYDPAAVETYDLPPSQYRAPRFDTFVNASYTGTSMATPHVAGLAALLMSQGITNPVAVEAAIKRFAIDKGKEGRDDEYGEGLVSPRATLRGLGLIR